MQTGIFSKVIGSAVLLALVLMIYLQWLTIKAIKSVDSTLYYGTLKTTVVNKDSRDAIPVWIKGPIEATIVNTMKERIPVWDPDQILTRQTKDWK